MAARKRKGATKSRRRGPVGVGVIGLGFMGRTHLAAYRSARRAGLGNRIVAVCDKVRLGSGAGRSRGNLDTGDDGGPLFDPRLTRGYTDAAELLADEEVELVSICTHTPSHVDLAVAALRAGKHVVVEKPVATSSREAGRLARAAAASDRLCMPAMCIRFWPAWRWLREAIRSGAYGAVRSAVFRRIASRPAWAREFYGNADESGGALFDLHVHDADFVRFALGAPSRVTSTGTLDHLTTLYHYPGGPPHVVAEGGWDCDPGFAFEMNFTVVFDEATADFRLQRERPLLLLRGGRASAPRTPRWNGYEGEIRHVLEAVRSGRRELDATAAEAHALTRQLEAERKSLLTGRPVPVR